MNPAGTASDVPAHDDSLIGRVLADRYRIVAKLGEGAMGAVYIGEHLTIGRRDAIKVLRPQLAQDAEAVARFIRGTRNVSTVQHPNVCTIYDFSDTSDGIRFLAMEYVEGETLKELLDREGRLELRRAIDIAGQVAAALQAAHDVGIVHRDLKPGNIMVCRRADRQDFVKVVDFDIAKGPDEPQGEEVTRVGFVVGTPEYMSPEQLIGERLDGRSDLYSLAIVLFRMLAGQLPFHAATTQELMLQRLTGTPLRLAEVLPGAPSQLQAALDRALSRRAQDRHASVAEFAREIAVLPDTSDARAAAPRQREPAVAPTRLVETRRPPFAVPRHWYPAASVALAMLVLTAVAAATLLRRPPADVPPQVETSQPTATPAAQEDPPAVTEPDVPEAPPPAASASEPPLRVAPLLDRQLAVLSGDPTPAALRAVRDTALWAWDVATTRADRGTAAFVLAQAAFTAGDHVECARWARRGAELGAAGTDVLRLACE